MSFAKRDLIMLGTGWGWLSQGVTSISHASLHVRMDGGA